MYVCCMYSVYVCMYVYMYTHTTYCILLGWIKRHNSVFICHTVYKGRLWSRSYKMVRRLANCGKYIIISKKNHAFINKCIKDCNFFVEYYPRIANYLILYSVKLIYRIASNYGPGVYFFPATFHPRH